MVPFIAKCVIFERSVSLFLCALKERHAGPSGLVTFLPSTQVRFLSELCNVGSYIDHTSTRSYELLFKYYEPITFYQI